jgi:hypothetical protein
MKLAGRIAVSISEKIKGYSKLTADLINQFKNDPLGTHKIAQAFSVARLAVTGAVASVAAGASLSVAEAATRRSSSAGAGSAARSNAAGSGVSSREEAVQTANALVCLLEQAQEFADDKIASDAFVDSDSAAYLSFVSLVRSSVNLALNASFSLPLQKTVTLDRDRQAVELCAELYGEADGRLDEFIALNNFNIDEIELIPMGRKVSYYV